MMLAKKKLIPLITLSIVCTIAIARPAAAGHPDLAGPGLVNPAAGSPADVEETGVVTPAAASPTDLEGTWVVNIDLIAPPPFLPESFTALETYNRGGGMTTSNNMTQQLPGGQGSWKRSGDASEVTILFFTRDANGVANGTIKVRHTVTVDGQNAYTGTGVAEVRNLDDLLLGSVSFTSEGRRLE